MADTDHPLDRLIDIYCAAWSDADPARRRELLSEVWSPVGTYTDPTAHTVGPDELLAHIATVAGRRPGARVVRTSRVDAHHNLGRFSWHVVLADGSPLPDGLDLVELDDDGRIRRIIGFFGPMDTVEH